MPVEVFVGEAGELRPDPRPRLQPAARPGALRGRAGLRGGGGGQAASRRQAWRRPGPAVRGRIRDPGSGVASGARGHGSRPGPGVRSTPAAVTFARPAAGSDALAVWGLGVREPQYPGERGAVPCHRHPRPGLGSGASTSPAPGDSPCPGLGRLRGHGSCRVAVGGSGCVCRSGDRTVSLRTELTAEYGLCRSPKHPGVQSLLVRTGEKSHATHWGAPPPPPRVTGGRAGASGGGAGVNGADASRAARSDRRGRPLHGSLVGSPGDSARSGGAWVRAPGPCPVSVASAACPAEAWRTRRLSPAPDGRRLTAYCAPRGNSCLHFPGAAAAGRCTESGAEAPGAPQSACGFAPLRLTLHELPPRS